MVLPRLAEVKSDQALAFEHKYFSTMANVERKKLQAPAPPDTVSVMHPHLVLRLLTKLQLSLGIPFRHFFLAFL